MENSMIKRYNSWYIFYTFKTSSHAHPIYVKLFSFLPSQLNLYGCSTTVFQLLDYLDLETGDNEQQKNVS
jgi:hypothetical protein